MREKERRGRGAGEGRRAKGRVLLHEGKGVDKEEIGLEVAYEDAYAMRTSTRQGGALWTGALIPRCAQRVP